MGKLASTLAPMKIDAFTLAPVALVPRASANGDWELAFTLALTKTGNLRSRSLLLRSFHVLAASSPASLARRVVPCVARSLLPSPYPYVYYVFLLLTCIQGLAAGPAVQVDFILSTPLLP